jgi:hypothetical protein
MAFIITTDHTAATGEAAGTNLNAVGITGPRGRQRRSTRPARRRGGRTVPHVRRRRRAVLRGPLGCRPQH